MGAVQKSEDRVGFDWSRGLRFALAHLIFSLWIQLEIYGLHLAAEGSLQDALAFIASLPFTQLEHLLAAAVPGLLAAALWSRPWLRFAPVATLTALNAWLVIDQVVFGIFFDHMNLSLIEVQPGDLVDMTSSAAGSFAKALDAWFAINCVLGLASVIFATRRGQQLNSESPTPEGRASETPARAPFGRWLSIPLRSWQGPALSAWLIGSVACYALVDNHNLEHHALFSLVRSALPSDSQAPIARASEKELMAPLFGGRRSNPGTDRADRALARARGELAALGPRPNVLLVMLESVGSLQLLPGGRPSSKRTPVLAEMLERGVVFSSVYATFPGTVRSLVSLFTGGRTITWGSVWTVLSHRYQSPTFVSALAEGGYRTAIYSAGDMHFENLDGFMASLPFDRVVDTGTQPERWREANRLSSWGVNEDALRDNAVGWMARMAKRGDPFFLSFLTLTTHHPYTVPESADQPFSAGDEGGGDGPLSELEASYLNALHHDDAFLGRLFADMKQKELLDNTLIVVVGDHGEAFGERHPRNFTHKSFLYEENVRSFMLLLAPGALSHAVISPRVASMGDVLPTVLAALGRDLPSDVYGQSLWPDAYGPRPVFFHKNSHPEMWGLRDGAWKFIAQKAGAGRGGSGRRFQLYDLDDDPLEQNDLASQFSERSEAYDRRAAEWFATSNQAYVDRLEGYAETGGAGLAASEVTRFGPKRLAFGNRTKTGEIELGGPVDPTRIAVAWTLWVSYPEDKRIRYSWTSPSGEVWSRSNRISSEWSTSWFNYGGPTPMAEGQWRLTLWDGDERLISGDFEVALPRDQLTQNSP